VARASQTRTKPLGRRVRHFGPRHRISCYRIRWPEAPPRAWAPRRARRSLGIDSEALGAGFVPIRARSCAVPAGLLLGVVPSQRLAERLERASLAPSVGWGEGFASPRLGSQRLKGRLSAVFCLERHSAFHARLSPPAKIPTARARGRRLRPLGRVVPSERQWATLRPRRDEQRAPRTQPGRADRSSAPAGSCLSAMGGAAAPGACAAWAARARLWERASTTREDPAPPSTTALHRPSDASRSEPIAGRRGRAGPAQRRTAGHSAGFGQGVSRALSTPRPPGCVAGQPRTVPPRPADALRAARIAGGEIQLALPCGEGHTVHPTPLGQNCNR